MTQDGSLYGASVPNESNTRSRQAYLTGRNKNSISEINYFTAYEFCYFDCQFRILSKIEIYLLWDFKLCLIMRSPEISVKMRSKLEGNFGGHPRQRKRSYWNRYSSCTNYALRAGSSDLHYNLPWVLEWGSSLRILTNWFTLVVIFKEWPRMCRVEIKSLHWKQ